MLRKFFIYPLIFVGFLSGSVRAQSGQNTGDPIEVLHADRMILKKEYPDLKLLEGHVQLRHKDALLTCDKALLDTKHNFAEAIGNVVLNQGDTLRLYAGILRYDGSRDFSMAIDRVRLYDPTMQLETDTLYYDKRRGTAFYRSGGVIRDSVNVLRSRVGKYFVREKRYEFINRVKITNPDYTILSAHLDYNTHRRTARFFGPTKILSNRNMVYAERGQYNMRDSTAWFTRNAFVRDSKTWTAADSIYSDRQRQFYSATGHVRIKDSLNKVLILAGYAELWQGKDSVMLDRDPVVINYEKDTFYLAAKHIMTARHDSIRLLWAYPSVAFYQKGFSGRADSLFQSSATHRIELYRNPVLWNNDSQITGDTIFVRNDAKGRHIDSLIIPSGVFIIQKEPAGYNQIKGKKLKGKFRNGRLRHIDITGNTETIYYLRDDQNRLNGIDRSVCSEINMELDTTGQAERIYLRDKPQGTTYPPGKIPEHLKKLSGFNWRGDERIRSAADLLKGRKPDFLPPKQKPIAAPENNRKNKIRLPASFRGKF